MGCNYKKQQNQSFGKKTFWSIGEAEGRGNNDSKVSRPRTLKLERFNNSLLANLKDAIGSQIREMSVYLPTIDGNEAEEDSGITNFFEHQIQQLTMFWAFNPWSPTRPLFKNLSRKEQDLL